MIADNNSAQDQVFDVGEPAVEFFLVTIFYENLILIKMEYVRCQDKYIYKQYVCPHCNLI